MDHSKALVEVYRAKRSRDDAVRRYQDAQEAFLAQLDGSDSDQDRHETDYNGIKITGSKVTSSTLDIDEEGLREELGEERWRAVSRRVLDRKLLEDAIVRDRIDASALANNSREVSKKPYVRLTIKEGERE